MSSSSSLAVPSSPFSLSSSLCLSPSILVTVLRLPRLSISPHPVPRSLLPSSCLPSSAAVIRRRSPQLLSRPPLLKATPNSRTPPLMTPRFLNNQSPARISASAESNRKSLLDPESSRPLSESSIGERGGRSIDRPYE